VLNIDAPESVSHNGTFTVTVNLSNVVDFTAFQFLLTFDDQVIRLNPPDEGGLEACIPGSVGSKNIKIESWSYNPSGTPGNVITVTGRIAYVQGGFTEKVTGSGSLVQIHFVVVGSAGDFSALTLSPVLTPPDKPTPYCYDNQSNGISVAEPEPKFIDIVE
jgi:hypothetical protein